VTVLVLVLSLLCLVNLLFSAAVVRRLREHTTILDTLAGEPPAVARPAGATVDAFTATAADGTAVGRDRLAGLTLVGFFSPGCGPCHERLPEFLGRAREMPGGRDRVLAVVVGDPDRTDDRADDMVAALAPDAVVVVEQRATGLARAFGVRGYPAFALVDADGVVRASGTDLRSIPIPVAV
jgi:hypothetical protein